ncbi:hypothetical protein PSY31_24135, partial [Shigella flexneri]|nr:hypothetical protein [Shigella flexneri]
MDYLRQGIHLRGYAQKDLKQKYKHGERFTFVFLLRIFLCIATQVDTLTQRWTICVRVSTCVAMHRKIRSRNTN